MAWPEPLLHEAVHQHTEAAPLLADEIGDRHMNIGKKEFGQIRGMRTDFLQVAALVESDPVRLDQHETDPLGSCGRIGLCRQNNEVAANSVGNEDFLSVDDVIVPIFYGARLDILHIAAAAWLGHP